MTLAAAWKRLTRLAVLGVAGCILASASVPAVSASTRLCRQLEAELVSVQRGGGRATVQTRRYDKAIAEQQRQLGIARDRARAGNCSASFFGGGECRAFRAKLKSMERNLDTLQLKRAELAGGGGSGRSRSRILAALDASGCRGDETTAARAPRDDRTLFSRLFGGGVRNQEPEPDTGVRILRPGRDRTQPDGAITLRAPPGEYRTLCVRTCDGYFFPMSNASSPVDFDRDRKNCETSCPGATVDLYYHLTVGEESESMISTVSGNPYSALPTAFLYKQPNVPSPAGCTCGRQSNFEVVAGTPPAASLPTEGSFVLPAKPVVEPVAKAEVPPAPAVEMPSAATGKPVRVVGPEFLPDPSAAIDLRAPVPTQVR